LGKRGGKVQATPYTETEEKEGYEEPGSWIKTITLP
jgi:hypothetical protein